MATDDLGNQRVAFEWGNVPMQPNNDRTDDEIYREGENNNYTVQYIPPALGTGDSHNIEGTSWNKYPAFKGSHNYMVTAAEYLGDNIYEFTSENELEVGDEVRTTNCPGFNGVATVVYADKLKFRTTNEHEGTTKVTGLRGRVDKLDPLEVGYTRNYGGAPTFVWPSSGLCYNNVKTPGDTWQDMIEYLRSCGVDPAILKEATFTGGLTKYDWEGGDYDDENPGIIFWAYIDPNSVVYVDWETGNVLTGKDFDGKVVGASQSWGNTVQTDSEYIDDFWFTAFTNDLSKNNTSGWL